MTYGWLLNVHLHQNQLPVRERRPRGWASPPDTSKRSVHIYAD